MFTSQLSQLLQSKFKNYFKFIFLALFTFLFVGNTFAATGTITVTFDQVPSQVNVEKTQLKYNKDFAYSYAYDDGYSEGYHTAYKYLNGGEILANSTVYPGLYYTDGAGNEIPFAGGYAVTALNGAGNDIHFSGAIGYLDWNEMEETYNAGWSIMNHGYNADAIVTYLQDILSGAQYIYDNTPNHIMPQHLVVPNGLTGYIPYAFSGGMKSVSRQGIFYYFDGEDHTASTSPILVNDMDVNKYYMFRKYYNDEDYNLTTIIQDVDALATSSAGTNKYWRNAFSHKVLFEGDLQGHISWTKRKYLMDHIESNYGKGGDDSVWFAGYQDVYEYIATRNAVVLSTGLVGNTLTIEVNHSNVSLDSVTKSLSLLVDAQGANISSISYQNGDFEYHTDNATDGLINLEWGLFHTGTRASKTEYYVSAAESNRGESAIALAQTWVDFLDTGSEKTTFQTRVDNIAVRGETRQISVGKYSNTLGIWNSYNGYNISASDLGSLQNTDGEITDLSIGIYQRFTHRLDGQTTVVDGDGIYPNSVLERGLSLYGTALDPSAGIVELSGLDNNNTYDITLFGSTVRDYNDDRTVTIYSIGGINKELIIKQNTSNTVAYDGILPDENGNIYISVSQKESNYGYAILGAIVIDENIGAGGGGSGPADITSPVGTISYSTTATISGNVTATLSLDEVGTVTNNGGSSSYIFTDNGSFRFEFEDTEGNTGVVTAFVTWIDRIPSAQAASTIQVNLGVNSNVIGVWNAYNEHDDLLDPLNALKNTDGNITSVFIEIMSVFYGKYLGETTAVDGDGVYLNTIMERGLAMYGDSSAPLTGTVKVGGLDPLKTYNFVLFGSTYRDYIGDRTTTIYNINGVFKELSILQNTQNTITYSDISPDVNGDVFIDVIKKLPQWGYAMLNSLIVEEVSNEIDYVVIPRSKFEPEDIPDVEIEFQNNGYTKGMGALKSVSADTMVGRNRISFGTNRGKLIVPIAFQSKNGLMEVVFSENTYLEKSGIAFDGILNTPVFINTDDVQNLSNVMSAVRIGDGTEGTITIEDSLGNPLVATIRIPAPSANIGDSVTVSYSEDSGTTWSTHGTYIVISIGGESYVEFTTSHFTDFAVTLGDNSSFEGTFVINNDAASTSSQNVTLNMTTNPEASNMRFSNDGVSRSAREVYATTKSWTLTAGYEMKTVYAQFDADGDQSSDVSTSDGILYLAAGSNGESHVIVTISKPSSSCSSYFGDYDFGTQSASYSITSLTGSNANDLTCIWVSNAHSVDVATTTTNLEGVNTQYNIAFTNLELLATTFTADNNSTCNWSSTAYDTAWTPSTTLHVYLTKIADGKTCDYTLDSPDLTLNIPANQAIDTYTGKIVFTIIE